MKELPPAASSRPNCQTRCFTNLVHKLMGNSQLTDYLLVDQVYKLRENQCLQTAWVFFFFFCTNSPKPQNNYIWPKARNNNTFERLKLVKLVFTFCLIMNLNYNTDSQNAPSSGWSTNRFTLYFIFLFCDFFFFFSLSFSVIISCREPEVKIHSLAAD